MQKLFSTNKGFQITNIDTPIIGINDVFVEVISSFYSTGTEEHSAKKISESILKKAIRFKSQIIDLIKKKEFSILIKKIKNQNTSKVFTGYSLFGKIISLGENVNNLRVGQYVVCIGEKASHGSVAVVPKGTSI